VTSSTENLIEGLAGRLVPVPAKLLERRLAIAVIGGAIFGLSLIVGLLGLRPDLRLATASSDFWCKLGYTAIIALVALAGARRLARPEVTRINLTYFAVPIAVLVLLALFELSSASTGERSTLIFGATWRECPVLIAALSLPLLAILLRLFSGFATHRPRLTGAVIGVAAGATTAALYSLHCPESAMTFLLLWYSAGIMIVATIGAFIGPRVLRW
jgi:hypothetical protein